MWPWSEDLLRAFMNRLNSFIELMKKFTYQYSDTCINFLDVNVSISDDRSIVTDISSKPTDTHQYLMASSSHPGHTKRNIAFSQALRICRICSNWDLAKMRCAQLEQHLIRRGHSKRHIKSGIQKAFAMFLHPVSDNT